MGHKRAACKPQSRRDHTREHARRVADPRRSPAAHVPTDRTIGVFLKTPRERQRERALEKTVHEKKNWPGSHEGKMEGGKLVPLRVPKRGI